MRGLQPITAFKTPNDKRLKQKQVSDILKLFLLEEFHLVPTKNSKSISLLYLYPHIAIIQDIMKPTTFKKTYKNKTENPKLGLKYNKFPVDIYCLFYKGHVIFSWTEGRNGFLDYKG